MPTLLTITLLALLGPYLVAAAQCATLRRERRRLDMERAAAEHAAYFARLRLVGERLLNTREAAEVARVSVHTIRAWTRRGLLAYRKDRRGHNQYREADVFAADLRVRRNYPRAVDLRPTVVSRGPGAAV